jgi:hypothetical protein
MIFRRSKKTVSKNISKVDRLITGIIITWAAASIVWLSRTQKGKKLSEKIFGNSENILKSSLSFIGKTSVKLIALFQKIKK